MPVLINEVVTEIVPVPQVEVHPQEEQKPLDKPEFDIAAFLNVIEERRARLTTD